MGNLREFEEIYDLAQNKIHSLTVERSKLKYAIAKEEQKQINMFVSKLLKIADFVVKYKVGKVPTGVKYPNNYADQQRGKYSIYIERDNCIYLGKTRNTCKIKILDCEYDKVDKNHYHFAEDFDPKSMMTFIREFNARFDIIMKELQDRVLWSCQWQIENLEAENNELRKVANL